jgi:exosome complex component RRP42
VTLAKINGTLIVDPILEEEQVMDARLTITFDKDDKICAMQKGGLGILTPEEVKRALPIALEKSRENRRKILEATGWIG